jgi:DNA-binding beta-propeller fold protein YncE
MSARTNSYARGKRLAVLSCLLAVGCTASAGHPASAARTASTLHPAGTVLARPVPAASTGPAITSTAIAGVSPGCSTAAAKAPELRDAKTAMVSGLSAPFGVAVTPDGRLAFVSEGPGDVAVYKVTGSSLAPTSAGTIRVTGSPAGETMTPDGRYLLVTVGSGADVIDVARAVSDPLGAMIGTFSDLRLSASQGSAIEVAVSPDGDYAFVTNEYADLAAVFNLRLALTRGFGPADYVGAIPLGEAAVGMAVSPDGRWLYATSEAANSHTNTGTLTVINLHRAETDPAVSVVATVYAGCNPVRVITSANGGMVWVDARASDDLLGFSAARLLSDPAHALVSVTRVGEAPVGLALVRAGALIVTANSNRFNQPGATATLSVVNVTTGKPTLLGYIPAGLFPRDMAAEPGGTTLFVANYSSGQLEAVRVPFP